VGEREVVARRQGGLEQDLRLAGVGDGHVVGNDPDVSSGREFGRQHIDRLDVRRRGEQLLGALHQGSGDGAVKVSLAALRAGEDVDDTECRGINLDREPSDRLGLSLG
jgi:hypothetical protein